jgi:hypothetical protein
MQTTEEIHNEPKKEIQDSQLLDDYLTEDPSVPGQNFVCLSFVSPEKVLDNKEEFIVEEFWKDFQSKKETFTEENTFLDAYRDFKDTHNETLEKEFHKLNNFKTTVRGIKIRGTYSTHREATVRAEVLQRLDKKHHVFVGAVGYWLPWDPCPDSIPDQVWQEKQLNELMKNYGENTERRNMFYEQQKEERKSEMIRENLLQKEKNAREQENDSDDDKELDVDEMLDNLENTESHQERKETLSNI